MARHYKKRAKIDKPYLSIDLSKIKNDCLCILDKICICSKNTKTVTKITQEESDLLSQSQQSTVFSSRNGLLH